MLINVKTALRISATTTTYDTEITDLIAAAQAEMIRAGVLASKAQDTSDPLIKRATTAYCKAHFGWIGAEDAIRLAEAFERILDHLRRSGQYCGHTVTFTVTGGGSPFAGAEVVFDNRTLSTNTVGVAVFAGVRPENRVEWSVSATGYVEATGVLDVDSNKAVSVALIGV